jgi:serine/threonine protein kinase/Tfp pilus assembly protein PilF
MQPDDDKTRAVMVLTKGVVINHYRIVEKIGAGGMGEVYLAEDTKLDRKVALKFLSPHLCQDEACRQRFEREAQAAAKLDHPNIVTVYEVGEYQGRPYFSMQHVEGQSLKEVLADRALSLDRILEIGIQVCQGLQAAHERGITHRDIKPSNILIDSHGRARIVDFGLASVMGSDHLTKTGSTLGTIGYMSPEQVRGNKVDNRTDLFSFGVVLYELITGHAPFKADSEAATLHAIANTKPELLARFRREVPSQLQMIIDKALDKEINTRYQHGDEIAADLTKMRKELALAETIVAGKPTVPARPSVAVLYLQNFSENKEDEYFAAGLTEDITTHLSKLSNLLVTSRSDVEQFKGRPVSVKDVAEKLRVSHVLEGSVRKYGNKIRVTCQLIKASDGYHLWAESYDRQLEDLFDIQTDVAKSVAGALRVILIPDELERVEKKPTSSVQAYGHYLQGRECFFGGSYSQENLQHATDAFERALEIDPKFAMAYAGLSDIYISYIMYSVDPRRSWLEKAERATSRALALDPNLAEAHRSRARLFTAMGQIDKAIQEVEEAVKINPNYGEAWRLLGQYYTMTEQYSKAEDALMKTLEVKPSESTLFQAIIYLYTVWGKRELVTEYFDTAMKIRPDNGHTFSAMVSFYLLQGEFENATRMARKSLDLHPDHYSPLISLLHISIISGDVMGAVPYLERYHKLNSNRDIFVELGFTESMKGDSTQALAHYDSCINFNRPLIKEFEGLPYEHVSRVRVALASALKGDYKEALDQSESISRSLGESLLSARHADSDFSCVEPLSFVYSLAGKRQEAMRLLEYLVKSNHLSSAFVRLHPWYRNLSGYAAFEALVNLNQQSAV